MSIYTQQTETNIAFPPHAFGAYQSPGEQLQYFPDDFELSYLLGDASTAHTSFDPARVIGGHVVHLDTYDGTTVYERTLDCEPSDHRREMIATTLIDGAQKLQNLFDPDSDSSQLHRAKQNLHQGQGRGRHLAEAALVAVELPHDCLEPALVLSKRALERLQSQLELSKAEAVTLLALITLDGIALVTANDSVTSKLAEAARLRARYGDFDDFDAASQDDWELEHPSGQVTEVAADESSHLRRPLLASDRQRRGPHSPVDLGTKHSPSRFR